MIPSGAAFMEKAREIAALLQQGVNKRFPRETSRLADEARIEGGTALRAVAMDTPEGDIQVAVQRDAWTTQIKRLEDIDNRNRDQEYLLRQLRRNVRELDAAEAMRHPTPENMGAQRMGLFGEVGRPQGLLGAFAASPAFAILLSPWTWLVALGAFCVLQMGLKERIEDQRDRARADLAVTEASRDAYARTLAEERAAHANDVAQVLEDTATTVDQMRRAQARQRAREQRERQRNEDLARGTNDYARRLRELAAPDEAVSSGPAAAPGGDPAGAMPTGPDSNANNGANP